MSLALIIVTTLYFLCSITLTLMLPYTLISPDAAFSQVLAASCFQTLFPASRLLPADHLMTSPARFTCSRGVAVAAPCKVQILQSFIGCIMPGCRHLWMLA